MKLIPMMTGESPSKSSKKLCQFLNDGVSKAMLRNFSNKLMQMAKAWFCSTSLPPGLSRKISILILMMIFSETLKTLKIFEVSNKIYVSFYQIRLNSCFMFNINMKSIISIMHTLPKGSHEQRYSHKCFQCSFLTKLFLLRNFRVFSVPIESLISQSSFFDVHFCKNTKNVWNPFRSVFAVKRFPQFLGHSQRKKTHFAFFVFVSFETENPKSIFPLFLQQTTEKGNFCSKRTHFCLGTQKLSFGENGFVFYEK